MTHLKIYDTHPPMREIRSSDLVAPLRFAAVEGRLFWHWADLANAVCRPFGKPLKSSQFRCNLVLAENDTAMLSAGKKGLTLMLFDGRASEAIEALSGRPDYDRELSRRVQQRMAELIALIGPELADKALEVAERTPAEPSVKEIVAQTVGAHELPLPEVMPPYPDTATAGIEELKAIHQGEPPAKMSAKQILDRMAAAEAASLKVASTIERLADRLEDAVEALRLAQAGIERRDEQIGSLERLIALAGQHLTAAVRHHS